MATSTKQDKIKLALQSAAKLIIDRITDVTNVLSDQNEEQNQQMDWDVVRDMIKDAANVDDIVVKRLREAHVDDSDSQDEPETVTVTRFACKLCAPYKLYKRKSSYKKHRKLHKQREKRRSLWVILLDERFIVRGYFSQTI